MNKKSKVFINSIKWIRRRLEQTIISRFLKFFLLILVLSSWIILLKSNFSGISQYLLNVQFRIPYILASWITIMSVYLFVGTTSWWYILLGFGEPITWINASKVQLASNLGKYIPGYFWQYFARAWMLKKNSISLKISGFAIVYELFITLWIGICLALIFVKREYLPGFFPYITVQPFSIILGAILLVIPMLVMFITPVFFVRFGLEEKKLRYFVFSYGLITLGWFLMSFALWLQGAAFENISMNAYGMYIFTNSSAFVLGILVVIVPNGLGVREGVIALILGGFRSMPFGIIIATLSRLLISASEIITGVLVNVIYDSFANNYFFKKIFNKE